MNMCQENPDSPQAALAMEAVIEGSLKALQFSLAKTAIEFWLMHRTRKFDQRAASSGKAACACLP